MSVAKNVVGAANIFCALLVVALAVPLLRRRIKMNRLYGVRFAKSFESDELWYRINEFGARRLLVWSVPVLLVGLGCLVLPFTGDSPWIFVLAAFPLIYVIPAIESYRYAKRL